MRPLLLRVLSTALGVAGCASAPPLYDDARTDDPELGVCRWSGRYQPPIVFLENRHMRGYFEAADYRRAIPEGFAMPPRPMVRVSVLDFYAMENGPTYREAEVS